MNIADTNILHKASSRKLVAQYFDRRREAGLQTPFDRFQFIRGETLHR